MLSKSGHGLMHFLASIWVSQTGSPTVLCFSSCCLFHSMGKWSTHTCLINKWQGPNRAVGLGLWSWLHSLFIGDFLWCSDLPPSRVLPQPSVVWLTFKFWFLWFILWRGSHGWSWASSSSCHCTRTTDLPEICMQRVLSQLLPSSMEMPSSAFLKVTARTMEKTGSPNSWPHSEDAEVWKPADVTLRLGQGGGIFWERLGLSSCIHMARDELSNFSYWAPSNHLGSVVFFPPGVCSSQGDNCRHIRTVSSESVSVVV